MNKPPFEIGDKVRTYYHPESSTVVRQVIRCVADAECGSGWRVWVDNGGVCPTCGRERGMPISDGIDSSWFTNEGVEK